SAAAISSSVGPTSIEMEPATGASAGSASSVAASAAGIPTAGAVTGAISDGAASAWGASAWVSAVAAEAPPNSIAAAIAAPAPARPARSTGVTARMVRRWVWFAVFDTYGSQPRDAALARMDVSPPDPVRDGALRGECHGSSRRGTPSRLGARRRDRQDDWKVLGRP